MDRLHKLTQLTIFRITDNSEEDAENVTDGQGRGVQDERRFSTPGLDGSQQSSPGLNNSQQPSPGLNNSQQPTAGLQSTLDLNHRSTPSEHELLREELSLMKNDTPFEDDKGYSSEVVICHTDSLKSTLEARTDSEIPFNTPEGFVFKNNQHQLSDYASDPHAENNFQLILSPDNTNDEAQHQFPEEAVIRDIQNASFIISGSGAVTEAIIETFSNNDRFNVTQNMENLFNGDTDVQDQSQPHYSIFNTASNSDVRSPSLRSISQQGSSNSFSSEAQLFGTSTPVSSQNRSFSTSMSPVHPQISNGLRIDVPAPPRSPSHPLVPTPAAPPSSAPQTQNTVGYEIFPGTLLDGSAALFKSTHKLTKEMFVFNATAMSVFQGPDFNIEYLPTGIDGIECIEVRSKSIGNFAATTEKITPGEFSNENSRKKRKLGEFSTGNHQKQPQMMGGEMMGGEMNNLLHKATATRNNQENKGSEFDLDFSFPASNSSFCYSTEPMVNPNKKTGKKTLKDILQPDDEDQGRKRKTKKPVKSMRFSKPKYNEILTRAFYDNPENDWIDPSVDVLAPVKYARVLQGLNMDNKPVPNFFSTMFPYDDEDRKGWALQTDHGMVVSRSAAFRQNQSVKGKSIDFEVDTCVICDGIIAAEMCATMFVYIVHEEDSIVERQLYSSSMLKGCYYHFRSNEAFLPAENPLDKDKFSRARSAGRARGRGRGRGGRKLKDKPEFSLY